MEKILSIILVIASIFSCFSAMAWAEEMPRHYSLEDGVACIDYQNVTIEVFDSVEKIRKIDASGGLAITPSIFSMARVWDPTITTVIIEYGIDGIGDGSFSGFESLENIIIPSSVESVGEYAFAECINLSEVTLPEGVKNVGEGAFIGCSSLERVILPESIKEMGGLIFNSCISLKSIKLPDNVNTILDSAFGGCYSLEHIILPLGIKFIDYELFLDCYSLRDIEIPDGVKEIRTRAFSGCQSLSQIIIPNSVEYIDQTAFECCDNLVIYCNENSYAHEFAIENNIPFIITNPHQHVYKTVITEPTCTSEGYTTHTCINCGDSYVDNYTNKKEHTLTTINHKCATREETGYTGDTYCVTCNSILKYGEEIPKIEESATKSLGNILNYISRFLMRIFGILRGFNLI